MNKHNSASGRWRVINRRPISAEAVVYPADAPGTLTYAILPWEVTEVGPGGDWRIRRVDGPPLYAHESGHLETPMRIAAMAMRPVTRALLALGLPGYPLAKGITE